MQDGLTESWCSYITVGQEGRIWVSHGGVNEMSCITGVADENGRYVKSQPSPGDDLKVVESCSGRLWSLYSNGVQLFQDNRWQQFRIDEIVNEYPADRLVRQLVPFLPCGVEGLLYLLPQRLTYFNPGSGATAVLLEEARVGLGRFNDMTQAGDGAVWLACELGLAKIRVTADLAVQVEQRHPLKQEGLRGLRCPVEGVGGRVAVVAGCRDKPGGGAAVCLENGIWHACPAGRGSVILCWPDVDRGLWLLKEGNRLSYFLEGQEIRQEQTGMLAAELREVAVQPDGVFWLTSSHGVMRYTPSIWRTPFEVADVTLRVHAMLEDRAGRVWFAAGDLLLMNSGEVWKRYRLPAGLSTQPYFTQSVCELPDGRIVVGTIPYNRFLLAFDPETESFQRLTYRNADSTADGRRYMGLIAPGKDGRLLVQTFDAPQSPCFRIEEFDGRVFRTLIDRGENWNLGNLRYILELSGGGLWIAGQSERVSGVLDSSGFHYVEAAPVILDNGFFCMCELEPGRVWVGGRHGIWEMKGGTWTQVRTGLSAVRSIQLGSNGTVWVASGDGVHRYVEGSWIDNTEEDGLPNTGTFSVLEDSRGRVWAGTIQGVSLFRPEADHESPETFIPRNKNHREVSPEGNVTLIFSGFDRWKQTRPERLLYSYSLDRSEWSVFQPGNTVEFRGMSAGPHHFEVRSMDVNHNADPSPASFEFTVLQPWYRESGFQVVAGLGSLIILGLLGYALHRHINLERLVVHRTNDLREANILLGDKISELMKTEEKLRCEHSRLEATLSYKSLLTEIASGLNTSSTTGEEVLEVLEMLGRRMSLDKVSLQNLTPLNDEQNWPVLLLNVAEKAWNDPSSPVDIPPESLVRAVARDWCVVYEPGRPGDPEWSEWFAGRGIGAACVFPVATRRSVDGLIIFSRSAPAVWQYEEVELLKTAADMIVNAWLRYSNSCAMLEAEKQRADALQMAERASRLASIGVMAAGITHEINQPLNDIKVTADSVLLWDRRNHGLLPEEFSGWLRSITRSVSRIDGIIHHMRSYWVPSRQQNQDELEVNAAVRSALSLIDRQLTNHGVRLAVDLHGPSLFVRGNRVHLEQIVLNLVLNAMHALDESGKTDKRIEVSLLREGTLACLEVRDNGTGIPEGDGDKIFDPFYSTKKPGEGMGLGLAIVRRFVQGLGGSVSFWNNYLGGATFRIELKLSGHSDGKES
ncbi:hypothetical protein LLH00_02555 [bacterium]|nr:hypothetical protein [bacterium]